MSKFQVGDRIRVKTEEEFRREFDPRNRFCGEDLSTLRIKFSFTNAMKFLINQPGIITEIIGEYHTVGFDDSRINGKARSYSISSDMITKVYEKSKIKYIFREELL